MRGERLLARLVTGMEAAAGAVLGIVALLVFLSAIGRYLFATPIPDSFDLSRLLLGTALLLGFAVVARRDAHIRVDLLVDRLPPTGRRLCDLLAGAALLLFTLLFAWKLASRTWSAFASGEATFDLRLPVWPFSALAVFGLLVTVLVVAVRVRAILCALHRGGGEETGR